MKILSLTSLMALTVFTIQGACKPSPKAPRGKSTPSASAPSGGGDTTTTPTENYWTFDTNNPHDHEIGLTIGNKGDIQNITLVRDLEDESDSETINLQEKDEFDLKAGVLRGYRLDDVVDMTKSPNTLYCNKSTDVCRTLRGKTDYWIVGDQFELKFTPVAGYEIKITYFKDPKEAATFKISKNATKVSATLNGSPVSCCYDPNSGVITFNPPPAHGDKVQIRYTRDNGIKRRYRAEGPDGAPVSQWHYNGKFYSASRNGDEVELMMNESMFKGGEVVQVIYELPKGYVRKINLSGYVDKTFKILESPSQCPEDNFKVEGTLLTFVCDPGNTDQDVRFSYQTYTYDWILITDIYDGDAGNWEVKVNGQPTTEGKVKRNNTPPNADPPGSYFTFNPPVVKGNTITIQFFPQSSSGTVDAAAPGGTGLP